MPTNAPVHLLHALWIFSHAESVAQAARELGITQPALTKQLQALASRLPTPLFATRGKRKTLTPFARELCAGLEPRFAGLPQWVRRITALHADPRQARVEISARREILDRISPHARFAGRLVLAERGHDEIIAAVLAGQTDIGITHDAPPTHELIRRPLFRERFQAVVPRSLAPRRPAKPELGRIPCVAYKDDDPVLRAFSEAYGFASEKLSIRRVTANYASLARLVSAGLGWGVLPTYWVPRETPVWTYDAPTHLLAMREFRLLYRPELARSPWLADLRASLRTALEC